MQLKEFVKLKLLGKGSYGSVYKVRYTATNETLALKEMNIKPMNSAERKSALNEVRLLASIIHPNIVEYKFSFLEDGRLYIVTELADNGDLDHLIQRHQQSRRYLDEDLIWTYFAQICLGLNALHKHGIVHRDLKSSNILICQKGVLKLADFGVAKIMKGAEYVHTSIGTPYYLSPEQWKDQPYNEKTDMWSLGIILYEMTALRLPFQGMNINDLSRNVVTGTLPRLPGFASLELQNLITRLLMKNPKVRPSADELLEHPLVKPKLQLMGRQDAQVNLIDTIVLPRRMSMENMELPRPSQPQSARNDDDSDEHSQDPDIAIVVAPSPKPPTPQSDAQQRNAPSSAPSAPRMMQRRPPPPPEMVRPPVNPYAVIPSGRNVIAAARQDIIENERAQMNAPSNYARQYGASPDQVRQPYKPPEHMAYPSTRVASVFPPIRSAAQSPAISIYGGDHRRRKYDYNMPPIGPNRLF